MVCACAWWFGLRVIVRSGTGLLTHCGGVARVAGARAGPDGLGPLLGPTRRGLKGLVVGLVAGGRGEAMPSVAILA